MNGPSSFSDVLDAAEQLDAGSKAELIAILSRRLAMQGRERLAESVAEADREFAAGLCIPMTPEEIMRDALS